MSLSIHAPSGMSCERPDTRTRSRRIPAYFALLLAMVGIGIVGCATDETGPRSSNGAESISATELEELMERAERGEPAAEADLAFLYMTGRGVPRDRQMAIGLYKQAAAGGDAPALRALHELEPDAVAQLGLAAAAGERSAPAEDPDAVPKLPYGDYHALVIGNAAYRHIEALETPARDAAAIGDILANHYGFDVRLMIDVNRDDLTSAIWSYRNELGPNDNLLIYYAGHGISDEDADEAYWLPVDSELTNGSKWISNATVTSAVRAIPARHVLVVADSCYSGTLTRGVGMRGRGIRDLRRLVVRRSRTALTSGGLEPVIDGGGEGNSVFAKAVLMALAQNRSVLEAVDLYTQIRRYVMLQAQQTPQYGDIRNAGHEDGEFVFVRRR